MSFSTVEPIINGTISGAFSAKITGGIASPELYANSTRELPIITFFGVTNDSFPFFGSVSGVGVPTEQIARIVSTFQL